MRINWETRTCRDQRFRKVSTTSSYDDQLVQFLDIVSRDIIGVNDLVKNEGGSVVSCGEVSINLWCEDVIVVVQQCQLLHRAEVDL